MNKTISAGCIAIAVFLGSCTKEDNSGDAQGNNNSSNPTCVNIKNMKITATTPVNIGQPIQVNATEVGGYRIYSCFGPNNFTSQYPDNQITTTAELKHEGWYYVHVSSPDCTSRTDSVYIDVKLLQGTPSCTVTANTAIYSNLFDDSYTSVKKHIDAGTSLLMLDAYLPSNMQVFFHPYWRTKEPEDGIYTTVNTQTFDQFDYNYNKVFISTTKSSIYWSSQASQTVYVSHTGGKLQVRFCSLKLSGYNGTSYVTSASGNLLEN